LEARREPPEWAWPATRAKAGAAAGPELDLLGRVQEPVHRGREQPGGAGVADGRGPAGYPAGGGVVGGAARGEPGGGGPRAHG